MPGNLRERLQRIRLIQGTEATKAPSKRKTPRDEEPYDLAPFSATGWSQAGHLTLRREITETAMLPLPLDMPEAAGIIMPGINTETQYQDLLIFDLETTGLSGGAGTVAFLAAFGRFVPAGNTKRTKRAAKTDTALYQLRITQYLLLDYPGENDFVEALLGEFTNNVTILSYNGKSFDSQILKTRCLMNGITPPEYAHADLLFPARRLWKRILPNCSQGTIETAIFNIDRTGDTPGALAPEIWFSFLRTRDTVPLMGICDHNRRDICGLAAIFSAMAGIAADPFAAVENITVDIESLALRWYESARRRLNGEGNATRLYQTGHMLLQTAAGLQHPRAELCYGLLLLKSGKHHEGRELLAQAAAAGRPLAVQIAALRGLAIDSERRLENIADALVLVEQGLALLPPDSSRWHEFERRKRRLWNIQEKNEAARN